MSATKYEPPILREGFRAWNAGCGPVILLRIKCGAGAGRVHAYCSCGWSRDFMSQTKARRAADKHEEVNK